MSLFNDQAERRIQGSDYLVLLVSTRSISRCLEMMGRKSWVKTEGTTHKSSATSFLSGLRRVVQCLCAFCVKPFGLYLKKFKKLFLRYGDYS